VPVVSALIDFVQFLDRSWREWFRSEWTTIRPVLAARARVFADMTSFCAVLSAGDHAIELIAARLAARFGGPADL